MTRLFGVDEDFGEDAILGKLEGMKDIIEQVNKQFKDPVGFSQNRSKIYLSQFIIFELLGYSILSFSRRPLITNHDIYPLSWMKFFSGIDLLRH